MTILARVVKPGFDLIVCGAPSAAWLEWLATTEVPLTNGQMAWREIHLSNHAEAEARTATPAHRPTAGVSAKPKQFDLVDTEEL